MLPLPHVVRLRCGYGYVRLRSLRLVATRSRLRLPRFAHTVGCVGYVFAYVTLPVHGFTLPVGFTFTLPLRVVDLRLRYLLPRYLPATTVTRCRLRLVVAVAGFCHRILPTLRCPRAFPLRCSFLPFACPAPAHVAGFYHTCRLHLHLPTCVHTDLRWLRFAFLLPFADYVCVRCVVVLSLRCVTSLHFIIVALSLRYARSLRYIHLHCVLSLPRSLPFCVAFTTTAFVATFTAFALPRVAFATHRCYVALSFCQVPLIVAVVIVPRWCRCHRHRTMRCVLMPCHLPAGYRYLPRARVHV